MINMLATYSQMIQEGNSLYNTYNFSVSLRLFQKYFLIKKEWIQLSVT